MGKNWNLKSHLPSFIRRREKPNIFGIAAAVSVPPLQIWNDESDLTEPYRHNLLPPANTELRRNRKWTGSVERLGLGAGNRVENTGEKDKFFL